MYTFVHVGPSQLQHRYTLRACTPSAHHDRFSESAHLSWRSERRPSKQAQRIQSSANSWLRFFRRKFHGNGWNILLFTHFCDFFTVFILFFFLEPSDWWEDEKAVGTVGEALPRTGSELVWRSLEESVPRRPAFGRAKRQGDTVINSYFEARFSKIP